MTAPLDYAPKLPWFRRRKFRRTAIWLTLLAALVTAGVYFIPHMYRRFLFLHYQNQCMTHLDPPGTVAMNAPPISPGTFGSTTTGLPWPHPKSIDFCDHVSDSTNENLFVRFEFYLATGGASVDAHHAFLHKRTSSAGDRLVVATAHSDVAGYHDGDERRAGIRVALLVPGTYFQKAAFIPHSTVTLPIHLNQTDSLRIYAGQPDPADESAFTFDFELNSTRHTARFRLNAAGDAVEIASVTPPL